MNLIYKIIYGYHIRINHIFKYIVFLIIASLIYKLFNRNNIMTSVPEHGAVFRRRVPAPCSGAVFRRRVPALCSGTNVIIILLLLFNNLYINDAINNIIYKM